MKGEDSLKFTENTQNFTFMCKSAVKKITNGYSSVEPKQCTTFWWHTEKYLTTEHTYKLMDGYHQAIRWPSLFLDVKDLKLCHLLMRR